MSDTFQEGLRLFNARKFFECHEALEALWLKSQGEEKIFLQGLIQVAAAFHHHTRRNREGTRVLLEEGWRKLARFGAARNGVNLARLRKHLQPWREYLAGTAEANSPTDADAPPFPRLTRK